MRLFGFGKKKDVVDLTEHLRKKQEKIAQMQSDNQGVNSQSVSGGAFDFLGKLASSSRTESGSYVDVSGVEDKRKKLAKRFMDITSKMEELSNQIYHLQQRIEVLEKKMDVNRF